MAENLEVSGIFDDLPGRKRAEAIHKQPDKVQIACVREGRKKLHFPVSVREIQPVGRSLQSLDSRCGLQKERIRLESVL